MHAKTLPVKDPLHKVNHRNVDCSGFSFSVSFGFNFAAQSDAKLSSELLQLGSMPESERHLRLRVKLTY